MYVFVLRVCSADFEQLTSIVKAIYETSLGLALVLSYMDCHTLLHIWCKYQLPVMYSCKHDCMDEEFVWDIAGDMHHVLGMQEFDYCRYSVISRVHD